MVSMWIQALEESYNLIFTQYVTDYKREIVQTSILTRSLCKMKQDMSHKSWSKMWAFISTMILWYYKSELRRKIQSSLCVWERALKGFNWQDLRTHILPNFTARCHKVHISACSSNPSAHWEVKLEMINQSNIRFSWDQQAPTRWDETKLRYFLQLVPWKELLPKWIGPC